MWYVNIHYTVPDIPENFNGFNLVSQKKVLSFETRNIKPSKETIINY